MEEPVAGPRMARRLNIDGDGQGDLNGHGGEQRAVLVYQIGSYRYWQRYFGRDDFGYGQFGENLTVGFLPGTDPERRDYASLADFADPDGNTWVIQEIGHHPATQQG